MSAEAQKLMAVDKILQDAQEKLVNELIESVGRFEARRTAALFFEFDFAEGNSVAMYVAKKIMELSK